MRKRWIFAGVVAPCLGVIAWSFAEARRDPVVRRASIALPHWPAGAPPLQVVLLSDIHMGSFAMDQSRLNRIVDQVNALHPDLVLIAGDFVNSYGRYNGARYSGELVAPLARLQARYGVVAVPGNHDYWTNHNPLAPVLAQAHIRLLRNQAIAVGPLALGGIDDAFIVRHAAHLAATLKALRQLPGAPLLFSHSPEIAPYLPADTPLLLAGHTHCGQVVFPEVVNTLLPVLHDYSHYRYRCGLIHDGTRTVIVTAGLGTTFLPLRLGVPPDLWLLTLGPAAPAAAVAAH